MGDPDSRRAMLAIAESYQKIAVRSEAAARRPLSFSKIN
jgi:hypothetical protein